MTVLGTCVAVCLWNRVHRYGGMNHYLLPRCPREDDASPKYGDVAIAALLKRMSALGARRGELVAKVFGGRSKEMDDSQLFDIGARNSVVAIDVLSDSGVEIIAHSLGGEYGRRLSFDTRTGEVIVHTHRARGIDR